MRHGTFLTAVFLISTATRASAQELVVEPAQSMITGVVRDRAGAPLTGASVSLDNSTEHVLTAQDGAYRLVGVKPGVQTVVVRRLGFAPKRAAIRASGHVKLDVMLEPVPATLGQVKSTASRVGLTGLIVDTLGIIVSEADVRVYPGLPEADTLRSHSVARAAADGSFFVPLAPGRYTLRVARTGYPPTAIVVSVPMRGGRCVIVRLGSEDPKAQQGGPCATRP